jgi:MFS family permease
MTAVYTLNLVDRSLMNLLLEPIKRDLNLSDTQLGFITGIAFGLFYATAGLPLARLADRGHRANLASAAIGLWGLTVMSCLWVGNFVQLAFARIAAAVGEAGCKPPTYSLVGDYFPQPVERARAMTVYMLGSPIASLLAFVIGGWLNEHFGWRATFFIFGVPGLLLALLVRTTLLEPRFKEHTRTAAIDLPEWKQVLATLWTQRSSRHLIIALVLFYMVGFGMGPWSAALMMRAHAMGTGDLGLGLGLIHGFGGISGILFGGYVTSGRFAKNEPAQMRATAVIVALLVPLMAAFLFASNKYVALSILVPQQIALYFLHAPIFTLLQRLVPDAMRATALAVVMLLSHLIGMGLGPQIVGAMSDLLLPMLGPDALRWAMLIACLMALWSSYHLWHVSHTVRADLATVGTMPTAGIVEPGLTARAE